MLEKMVPDIIRTAELVQEIASGSSEQHTGSTQIKSAILELDRVVQQNSAESEEVASSSEELASHAALLQDTISFFRLGGHAPRQPSAAPKAAPKHKRPKPKAVGSSGIALEMSDNDSGFERF